MKYKDRKTECCTEGCANLRRPRQANCRDCHAANMRAQRKLTVTVRMPGGRISGVVDRRQIDAA